MLHRNHSFIVTLNSTYVFLVLLLVCSVLHAEQLPTLDELETWFLSDELIPPSTSSDSRLTFIKTPATKPTLHSISEIVISMQSIKTGWVVLKQCYENLDPVPEMQVVYNANTIRKLTIIQSKNIVKVYIKGPSIQLENVQRNAKLCMSSEVKIFKKDKSGLYRLKNGPFHRQFLDSFFPFHLSLTINYPRSLMRFTYSNPKPQVGFIVNHKRNVVLIESFFTGKLYTEMFFKLKE